MIIARVLIIPKSMAFLKRLERLLAMGRERGLLETSTSEALLSLAKEGERGRGILNLTQVLGWLGGGVTAVGIILLIAANWDFIGGLEKIMVFLLLFSSVHGTALWIRFSGKPLEKTAEALHFLGAGLFLGGVALVAQVYHLNARPPNGVLLWLLAIAPLAWLLRSGPVTLLSIFALLLWAHQEGEFATSPLRMPKYNFTSHLMIEIGVGAALAGFSSLLRERAPPVAKVFRGSGVFLLFGGLYLLTFYRHYSDLEESGSTILPAGALILGAAGLASGAARLAPGLPRLRNRLVLLLGLVILLAGAALAADVGVLPRGEKLEFFNFGYNQTFDSTEWVISAAAWAIWFLLALWCVVFGAQSGRKAYLNTGVLGVGLGVVTLFFDLIGSLATTGGIFFTGGVVLLGTAFVMERWRRKLMARMGSSE